MDEPQEHDAKWNKEVPKYTNTVWTYLYEVYKIVKIIKTVEKCSPRDEEEGRGVSI